MLTNRSLSDYGTKKAEYYDEEGFGVADAENKDKLKQPKRIEDRQNQPKGKAASERMV